MTGTNVLTEFGIDEIAVDKLNRLSPFERQLMFRTLSMVVDDIIETRERVHRNGRTPVQLTDLPQEEQELAKRHLYD